MFFDTFGEKILPKVRAKEKWSGYYFERITHVKNGDTVFNPLDDIITRLTTTKQRNNFELSPFDPARDVGKSPYGGQCLSHLSFKKRPGGKGDGDTVSLTATYRNHYYIEKLLGNLIGLSALLNFVAEEANLAVGDLTVLSTHAVIDKPNSATSAEIRNLIC